MLRKVTFDNATFHDTDETSLLRFLSTRYDFHPVSEFPKSADCALNCVFMTDCYHMWQGWRDETGWRDKAETTGTQWGESGYFASRKRVPTHWAFRSPKRTVLLPDELDNAGLQLNGAVDDGTLPAQGAAWSHSPSKGWRYLLVTPDIELVRERLPMVFRSGRISQAMVPDDVDVVGPGNYTYQLLTKWVSRDVGPHLGVRIEGTECLGEHTVDDGTTILHDLRCNAVIHRMLKTVDGSDFRWPEHVPEDIRNSSRNRLTRTAIAN